MANTFAAELMPRILAGALDVLREEVPIAAMVPKDFSGMAGQIGDVATVSIPVAQAISDVTPAATVPALVDKTPTTAFVTIDTWKKTSFHLTAREAGQIMTGSFVPGQIGEAARALAFGLNAALWAKYKKVYGYAGTAGTNPFASTVNAAADVRQVLNRQFCPEGNRQLVVGHDEETSALKSDDLKKMLNAGDSMAMRRGEMGNLYGMTCWRDVQRPTHTAGTADTALVNNGAGYAAGTKTVTVDGEASGTFLEGDVITFGAVAGTYVIVSSVGGATPTSITFEPGLEEAVLDNATITIKATHKVNLAFDPAAFALAMRTPPNSIEGAPIYGEHLVMSDPKTGMPLKLSYLPGYHAAQWELSYLYGVQLVDPRRAARLAG